MLFFALCSVTFLSSETDFDMKPEEEAQNHGLHSAAGEENDTTQTTMTRAHIEEKTHTHIHKAVFCIRSSVRLR